MPYRLRKKPNHNLFWVVDDTGKKYSKEALPKERAEAQRRALYASESRELKGGMDGLRVDTGADVDYSTKLSKAQVEAIRKRIADIDTEADNMTQYREIKAILNDLKEADFQPHDWREIEALLANIDPLLAGKRGSKPHEFISVLEKVFDRVQGSGRGGVKISKKDFIKEHKHLLGVLKKGKRSELNAEYADQSAELKKVLKGGCWECRGGGPIPPRNLLQQIATASYQMNPPTQIGQLELVRATPTLKFYKAPDNTIIVGIRGTQPTDPQDVKADAMIGIGQLESAPRYLGDLQTLQQFQTQYPPSQYDYYGVGHSLGGAILDMFLKRGLIKNGVSYNPAVQPQDFQNNSIPNQRIYASNDPLYALMGRNLSAKPEVRPERQKKWWEKLVEKVPYAGKAYNLYSGHQLDQFAGGAKPHSKFAEQLRSVGIEPSLYLKEAQRRAKIAGLPYKLLGFANDDDHKLAIPDADGRMVKFGAVGYGDHLIWFHLEKAGKVPKGTAEAKKDRFHKSHEQIKGDWKKNPFSANNLALKVLW